MHDYRFARIRNSEFGIATHPPTEKPQITPMNPDSIADQDSGWSSRQVPCRCLLPLIAATVPVAAPGADNCR